MKSLKKPIWIKMQKTQSVQFSKIKNTLRHLKLNTVCEAARCPNITECFGRKTAAFLILGETCTRRCPFCNVPHGKPDLPNPNEAQDLAQMVERLGLNYVVITSVNRDDLEDGGATQFLNCVVELRKKNKGIKIEILTPDFRFKMEKALFVLKQNPPDVFNHNLETVPNLYKKIRPGADYQHSLNLLKQFKRENPEVLTKSGLMVGLGENKEELIQVLKDLKENKVDFLTLGQYLQPSKNHVPVARYYDLEEFKELEKIALDLGFLKVAAFPMARSSYWADDFFPR